MDFKDIYALRDTTNRIVDLDRLIKKVHKQAAHCADVDASKITLKMYSLIPEKESQKQRVAALAQGFLNHTVTGVVVDAIAVDGDSFFTMEIDPKYQAIIYESIIKSLTAELEDLNSDLDSNYSRP